MSEPVMAPDVKLYSEDVPETFLLTVTRNGQPVNLSASTMTATVSDNGVDIGSVEIDRTSAAAGQLLFTIPTSIYTAMKRYATLRFYEGTLFRSVLMQRRLVKVQ